MNIAVQYVTDSAGKPQAVQLSLTDWEALIAKLNSFEKSLALKSDPDEAHKTPATENGEDLPYFDAAHDWDTEASTLRASSNMRRSTPSW